MAKKLKKAAKKRGPIVFTKQTTAPEDGLVLLTGNERLVLRSLANRVVAGKGVSAFDRAMALEVGEVDFAQGIGTQSLAMSISQARRRKTLGGRMFTYGNAPMAVGRDVVHVLWIKRTK